MLALIGLVVLILAAVKVLFYLYEHFRRKRFVWLVEDQWCVVTGCTSGLGFEFARQLALKGYNLMLISRSADKLEATKKAIQSEVLSTTTGGGTQIQIRTLAVDFTRVDIYDQVKAFLDAGRTSSIYILVNNVGNAPSSLDYFLSTEHRLDPDINQKLITVNAIATTKMIELVLPSMVENGRGLLINVGSMSSRHIVPMISLYSATKAFVSHLSESLAVEYGPKGITVATLLPSQIATKQTEKLNQSRLTLPRDYVQSALAAIKYKQGFTGTGYWAHSVMNFLLQLLNGLTSKQFTARLIQMSFQSEKAALGCKSD